MQYDIQNKQILKATGIGNLKYSPLGRQDKDKVKENLYAPIYTLNSTKLNFKNCYFWSLLKYTKFFYFIIQRVYSQF